VEGDKGLESSSGYEHEKEQTYRKWFEKIHPDAKQDTITLADWLESLCPYYMSLGVSYDEYWHGDPTRLFSYIKGQEWRDRRRNTEIWLQGRYMYDAIMTALHNAFRKQSEQPIPYLKEPYPLTEEEAEEREQRDANDANEIAKAKFEAWAETTDFSDNTK